MRNFWGLTTRKIAYAALMVALNMVLVRLLSISVGSFRVNLGFLPIAVLAMIVNPMVCGMCAALADGLGYIIFPMGGAYLPWVTVCAFLYGLLFGLFYYRKKITLKNIIISNSIGVLMLDLCVKTYFLSALYPWGTLIVTRPIQCAILLAVQIPVIFFTNKYFIQKYKSNLEIG